MYTEHSHCRHCNTKLTAKHKPEGWKADTRKAYYFKVVYRCDKCGAIYLNECDKVIIHKVKAEEPEKVSIDRGLWLCAELFDYIHNRKVVFLPPFDGYLAELKSLTK